MKKNINYVSALFLVIPMLISCEKELSPYEGKSAVYFQETERKILYSGEVLKDSSVLSFSLAKAVDSTVNMVVAVMGGKTNVDRPYKLSIDASSNVTAGVHYTILNESFSIKANQVLDTVKIKFFRTEDLLASTLLLSFRLEENENFSTKMNDRLLNATTGKRHSFINYRWFVNDIIKKPGRWQDGYLGPFSRKKLFLMVEVTGVDPAYMDSSIGLPELAAYGSYMQRYLNEQRLAGNTILEENGSVMIMGAAVQ